MDDRRDAIAVVRREIARRIARFCTSLPAEEFDKLVDRMAHIQWKYEVFPHRVEPLPIAAPESLQSETSTKPGPGTVG
jgi:hypothetical protein